MIKAVRGTRDLLPPDTARWNFVEAAAREVFRAYNFQEIRTPIFEATELFARGVGEDTDIVSKEMFTWFDRGEDPESVLRWAWWGQYGSTYASSETLLAANGQPAFVVRTQAGAVKMVATRMHPDAATVMGLRDLSARWVEEHGQPAPQLAVAAPAASLGNGQLDGDIEAIPMHLPSKSERAQSLTLRPEATAGIVRAYIEHKLWDRGLNKLYCMGPMFRRERPQKGRYRQFYQIDAEVIGPPSSGSDSPARDAEVLEMLATLLDRLGIRDWNLELNSVGSSAERVKFNDALRLALDSVKDQMCVDCRRRAVTNPLRVLDCKVPGDQPIIETLPRITDFLAEESRRHFDAVQNILLKVGVRFALNPRLVRGLDYYTRTAFEFTHGALGAQNAILGGGRYDGLSEALGGPAAPGIGFAIGEDRLVMSLEEKSPDRGGVRLPDVYIAPMTGMNPDAAALARELRRHDLVVELGNDAPKLGKSFEAASKAGAKYILIVGENEVRADAYALKNLASGEQVSVPRSELVQKIQS
jgi:histidyl-tRNA synthetase